MDESNRIPPGPRIDNQLGLAALVRERNGDRGPHPRLLISCRTHYFRTLRDQQNHFTGQERAGPDANAFRALVLLRLTEDQVRGYLAATLPDQDPDRILATVAAVHNLTELTQRPYTLKLVADQLPAIEARRLAGRPVFGTTLYGGMVLNWLERDSGKHHIHPDHKLRLAAHLAAHLWREGNGVLPAARLEPWFHAWLEGEPDLRPPLCPAAPGPTGGPTHGDLLGPRGRGRGQRLSLCAYLAARILPDRYALRAAARPIPIRPPCRLPMWPRAHRCAC